MHGDVIDLCQMSAQPKQVRCRKPERRVQSRHTVVAGTHASDMIGTLRPPSKREQL
jgi:hypothetical protein